MSDSLFPAGLIVDLSRLDLEMMQHYAKLWNVEHKQLGEGVFEGSLFGVHTPRIQMGISHFSHAVMTQGSFPQGCVVLYFYENRSLNGPAYNFHDRTIPLNEIVILTKNEELYRLTYDAIDIHTIAIEEDLFYKTFTTFFGDTPIKNKRLYIKEDKIALFHQTHILWISYLAKEFPKLTNKPDYDSIESEILHQFFSCMSSAPAAKKRKKFHTKIVRDLLHENIDKSVDMSMITKKVNIRASQLYNSFKKEYGISPKKYLQMLRFNAIRKELLLADPNSVSIRSIAKKYHILHMGHFAADYKQLFGETPSRTLNRKK
ncbi:MAG: hypothetical protein COB07_07870 [Sulfurovum sp.]|nr:MAG: hypothetical protein COB07_07870 [Sulfurovum sp.]